MIGCESHGRGRDTYEFFAREIIPVFFLAADIYEAGIALKECLNLLIAFIRTLEKV